MKLFNNKNTFNLLVALVLTLIVAWNSYRYFTTTKLAYVNTIEVYNQFQLKIELEKKLEKTKTIRQQQLDSLLNEIEPLVNYLQVHKGDERTMLAYQQLKNTYLTKEKQFEEDNEILAQQYTDQIWKQLNQYVKDFGEKHRYNYIYGTSGQGNLMYAHEHDNISEQVIAFVNQQYQGS